jgi:hypothetical protein
MCVAGGGGGVARSQVIEMQKLVFADLLATVALKSDECGGKNRHATPMVAII